MNDSPLLGLSQRLPPTNIQAEQGVLGALLANNTSFEKIEPFLREEHFADPIHARIFRSIVAHIRAGRTVDTITLMAEFANGGILDGVGGTPYLIQLVGTMPSPKLVPEYARAVVDTWGRRELIDTAEAQVNDAFGGEDLEAALARARGALDAIEASVLGVAKRRPVPILEAVDRAFDLADEVARGTAPVGLMTGMPSVDAVLNGIEPGTMLVLGGRPGAGKTALALGWAIDIARRGEPVIIISQEMTAVQMARRALAYLAGVSAETIKKGQIARHIDALMRARQELAEMPLEIEDGGMASMAEIGGTVRAMKQKHGGRLGLIIVDHLHIVRPSETDASRGNPTAAITGISHDSKALAKSLECPVMMLAQLSRALTGRDDHRPQLSDLRQAGAIEEDADQVVFVHREEMYLSKAEPLRRDSETREKHAERVNTWRENLEKAAGKAQLIIDKNRGGETATIMLDFTGHTTTFTDPASREQADMGWPS